MSQEIGNNHVNEKRPVKRYLKQRKSSQSTPIVLFTYDENQDIYLCAFIKYDKKEQKFLSITDLPQKNSQFQQMMKHAQKMVKQ